MKLSDTEFVLPPADAEHLTDVRPVVVYQDPQTHKCMCRLCRMDDCYVRVATEFAEMIVDKWSVDIEQKGANDFAP